MNKQHRSAETGRFVTRKFADKNKATTYSSVAAEKKALRKSLREMDSIHARMDQIAADVDLVRGAFVTIREKVVKVLDQKRQ